MPDARGRKLEVAVKGLRDAAASRLDLDRGGGKAGGPEGRDEIGDVEQATKGDMTDPTQEVTVDDCDLRLQDLRRARSNQLAVTLAPVENHASARRLPGADSLRALAARTGCREHVPGPAGAAARPRGTAARLPAVDDCPRIRMISCMRTTLILDDTLVRRAKRRAVERDLTLSDVVNEALREAFREPPVAAPPFSMVTFGRPERRVRHEPTDFAAAAEDQDREGLR